MRYFKRYYKIKNIPLFFKKGIENEKKTAVWIKEYTYCKRLLLFLKFFGLESLCPLDFFSGIWGALAIVTHWNDKRVQTDAPATSHVNSYSTTMLLEVRRTKWLLQTFCLIEPGKKDSRSHSSQPRTRGGMGRRGIKGTTAFRSQKSTTTTSKFISPSSVKDLNSLTPSGKSEE